MLYIVIFILLAEGGRKVFLRPLLQNSPSTMQACWPHYSGGESERLFEPSNDFDYTTVPIVMEQLNSFKRRMSEITLVNLYATEKDIVYQL